MTKCLLRLATVRVLRTTALGMVFLASAPAMVAGQRPPVPTGRCVGNCPDSGRGTGSGSGRRRQSRKPTDADRRESAAQEQNNKGIEAENRGDWAAAASYFQEALKNSPDDAVIRKNLDIALQQIAATDRQRQDAAVEAAAANLEKSSRTLAESLKAAPSVAGLDFDGGHSTAAPGSGNARVVDARKVPSGLPKSVEDAIVGAYSTAPAGVSDRVRKGFQAVMDRDWKVARAWFEDALNRDPGNAGLKHLLAALDNSAPRVPLMTDEGVMDAIDAMFGLPPRAHPAR